MKKQYSTTLWAGSDEAFEVFAEAESKSVSIDAAAYAKYASDDSGILEVQGGVGVIQVKGVLTNQDAWYNEYMGLISYATVQEALYRAVADPEVKEILLDIGSPGGTVYGLTETVDAVDSANKIKPVTMFSDSMVASAAMWLAAPASKRYVGKLAVAGSIGVVAKHTEVSRMKLEAGVTETIIRAGEFKQLANASEPLTEKARATIQESVSYSYGIFVQSIADYLGKSYQLVDTQMAQGREFMGQQAVEAGLVDAVSTFDDVFASMQTRISKNSNGGSSMKKKYAMSEAAKLAAAASGGVVVEAGTVEELEAPELLAAAILKADEAEAALTDESTDEEMSAADALRAEADELQAEATEGEEGVTDDPTDKTVVVAETTPTAIELLQTQLKGKEDEIFALKTDLNKAIAESESIDALKEIGAKAINNMVVALGGSETDFSATSASELVAQYKVSAERFTTEFKVGGVAATGSEEVKEKPESAPVSRMAQTRLKMVVNNK